MAPLVWVVGLALLWSPGFLLTEGLRLFRGEDRVVRYAIQIALGLTMWPVIFLWTSTLRLRWTPTVMSVIAAAVIAAALVVFIGRIVRRARLPRLRPALPSLALIMLLAVGAATLRVNDVRGLAFPPWVDGVHHVMIIRLLLDGGGLPATADPYIPGGAFFYHWGFHLPAALVAATTGNTAPPDVPPLLLQYGQLLNALTLVTMYAAGRVLLRSREAGVFAAVLTSFVSYFPAFYVSWGRYTHLAGTLVLPALLIVLWRLARSPRPWREGVAAVILASGLALIHVRVAFFALAFAVVVAAALLMKRRATPVIRWVAVALLAGIVILPWVMRLRSEPHVAQIVRGTGGPQAAALPLHLIGSHHNRELLALATCGLSGMAGWLAMPTGGRIASAAWWIILIAVSRFAPKSARARRAIPWRALGLVAAWCAVILLVLRWHPAGIDMTRFASLDSAVITLFMPLAIAGAALITWVVNRVVPQRRMAAASALLALVIAAGGATLLTDIVNPLTVFADAADLRALRWIARNTPADARFAVDARPWMAPAWVGVDGGYWIGVAAGRRSILPPLLYGWSLPHDEVVRIDTLLAQWSSRRWDVLRGAGVTHIYCGSLSPPSRRATLLADPRARLIYRDGGAVVFELAP